MSTISAKPELLDDEVELVLEAPRLPEPELEEPESELPVPDVPEVPELESEPVELEPPPAEMAAPGLVLASETIVPLAEAYSLVSASALWALRRFCSALSTAARAEAIAPGDGVRGVLGRRGAGR